MHISYYTVNYDQDAHIFCLTFTNSTLELYPSGLLYSPLSFAPSKSMMFVLGCFLLPLLLRSGWVPHLLSCHLGSCVRCQSCVSLPLGVPICWVYWDHICWSCSRRPAHAPDKPDCAFLARFGWTLSTNHLDPTQVTKVRGWLTECQSAIWSALSAAFALGCWHYFTVFFFFFDMDDLR